MTDHYYRVTWSPDDGEYAGLCAEFPSLSWLAATAEEAFSGIRALVHEVLADMDANTETPPAPLADRTYSGRFLVRGPPETHRAPRAASGGGGREPQPAGERAPDGLRDRCSVVRGRRNGVTRYGCRRRGNLSVRDA